MYKVGDKVIYNGQVRTVESVLDKDSNHIVLNGDFYARKEYVEPYTSAHDKLLAMGYGFKQYENKFREYTNLQSSPKYITVDEITKTWEVANSRITRQTCEIGLDLSRILTQLLEDVE